LNSSDGGSDFEFTSTDSECDNQTFPPEASCKTSDVYDNEHTSPQLSSDHDSEDNG